jgi:hypothetical protein
LPSTSEEFFINFAPQIIKKISRGRKIFRFSEPRKTSPAHGGTVAVIRRPFLRILQNLVGFRNVSKLLCGGRVSRVLVGMKLVGKATVGFLDLLRRSRLIKTEEVIIISVKH